MEANWAYNFVAEETYEDGRVIFREGSSGDWIYVIISGSVAISRDIKGQRFILEILRPGDLFGEIEFIGRLKRNFTARAIGDTTLGLVDREILDKEFNELSGPFRKILAAMTHRFKKVLDRASGFAVRAASRVPAALPLTFQEGEGLIKAQTGDLSEGGLFIRTEEPLSPGHRFFVNLRLPGVPEPLKIKCESIWARTPEHGRPDRPPGMGVKFREIQDKDIQRIREYIKTRRQPG